MNKIIVFSVFLAASLLVAGCKSPTSPGNTTSSGISGTVKDSATNAPIPGMTVRLFSSDTILLNTVSTNGSGTYSFSILQSGKYYVVAGNDSTYESQVQSVQVNSGANSTVSFLLQTVPQFPALHFLVLNATTGVPLNNAAIVAVQQNSAQSATWTGANGVASLYMSPGTLQITVTDSGFQDTSFTIGWANTDDVYDTVRLQPNQLLFLYRFSGSAIDSSGLGRIAILKGGTYVADRFGNANSALQFNGTTDYISIADSPDLDFGKTESFSICFWAKNAYPQPNSAVYLVRKATGSGNAITGYDLTIGQDGLLPSYGTTYGFGEGQDGNLGSDTRWHFYVYTFDRSSTTQNPSGIISSYYDNVEGFGTQGNGTALQGNINTTVPLTIGGNGTSANAFKGVLDDVRMYKGVLSSSDVNGLYHENGW